VDNQDLVCLRELTANLRKLSAVGSSGDNDIVDLGELRERRDNEVLHLKLKYCGFISQRMSRREHLQTKKSTTRCFQGATSP